MIKKTVCEWIESLNDVTFWDSRFDHFARFGARFAGKPLAFNAAIVIIMSWIILGPLFGFSDTWQLVINTGTTVITFLMVFLIQHTQNRDNEVLQIKMTATNAIYIIMFLCLTELKYLLVDYNPRVFIF